MGQGKIEAARRLRKQGALLKEIAAALDICEATASIYCRNVLPKWRSPADRRKTSAVEAMRELYPQGVPLTEIAKRIGVPVTTLYDWRREAGIERNSRRVYVTDELRERISRQLSRDPDGLLCKEARRLYQDEQLSTTEIAEKLGVTSVTVGQWLERDGVERRKRPTPRVREKLRQANLGAKRYNWKGGISSENVRIRTSLYMKLAREACFERDDYTCRSCGRRGGKLNAHHVWPFQRFPELKFEVSNLVTLCKECHHHFHKTAGGPVRIAIGPFFVNRIEAPQGA